MKIVLTHGTFDLLHYAHIKYLEKAKKYGDYLIVLITSDRLAREYGKSPYYDEKIRSYMVSALSCVDKVIIRNTSITSDMIKKYSVDVFISTEDGSKRYDRLKNSCEVIYLERTPDISSTKIKNDLKMKE